MQQQRVLSWLSQHNFPHGLVSFADGLSTDPLGHKTAYLNNLITNHGVLIHSAYGSSKDIIVYTNIGLKSKQIYIVGKVCFRRDFGALIRWKKNKKKKSFFFFCFPSGQQKTTNQCHRFDGRICFASKYFNATWWFATSPRQSTYGDSERMFQFTGTICIDT